MDTSRPSSERWAVLHRQEGGQEQAGMLFGAFRELVVRSRKELARLVL